MSNQLVVGFVFDDALQRVILVTKQRPEWMKGLLNGVGGHIEPGDAVEVIAMAREFREETGFDVPLSLWKFVGNVVHDNGVTIKVYTARSEAAVLNSWTPKGSDEMISVLLVDELVNRRHALVDDVIALVELSRMKLKLLASGRDITTLLECH